MKLRHIVCSSLLFCILFIAKAVYAEPIIATGPLDQPGISAEQILSWSSTTVVNLFTFDFKNVTQSIENGHLYFTNEGFETYKTALREVTWMQTMQRKKIDVLPVLNNPAVILKQGAEQGIYAWTVQVPLMLHFRGPFDMTKQHQTVTITLKRAPLAEFSSGIAIDALSIMEKS